MKRLLCIALGEISTGELSIATAFTSGLPQNSYECHYLVPADKARMITGSNAQRTSVLSRQRTREENRSLFERMLRDTKFDLIILFDIFTFEYSQYWSGINFELLYTFGIPIASLDEYEYTKAGYALDYYGAFVKRLPPLLEKCDFIFKNCPLSMPVEPLCYGPSGERSNEYYFRMFRPTMPLGADKRGDVRRKHITEDPDAKVILFTTSQWEVTGAYSFSSQYRLVGWLGRILHKYAEMLDERIVILHVGHGDWGIPKESGKVTWLHWDWIPVDLFENILQSVDLYVTFNLVSITLSKAVFYGTPALVLNNTKVIDFERLSNKLRERPAWYQEMANDVKKIYPFTASMFGWSRFLKTVLEGNIYVDTFRKAEFFNMQKTVDILRSVLFDSAEKALLTHNRELFYKQYFQLQTPVMLLYNVFGNMSVPTAIRSHGLR